MQVPSSDANPLAHLNFIIMRTVFITFLHTDVLGSPPLHVGCLIRVATCNLLLRNLCLVLSISPGQPDLLHAGASVENSIQMDMRETVN